MHWQPGQVGQKASSLDPSTFSPQPHPSPHQYPHLHPLLTPLLPPLAHSPRSLSGPLPAAFGAGQRGRGGGAAFVAGGGRRDPGDARPAGGVAVGRRARAAPRPLLGEWNDEHGKRETQTSKAAQAHQNTNTQSCKSTCRDAYRRKGQARQTGREGSGKQGSRKAGKPGSREGRTQPKRANNSQATEAIERSSEHTVLGRAMGEGR